MNSDHKPRKLVQSDLVYWFMDNLAYVAVLPAERDYPWASCILSTFGSVKRYV